MQRRRIKVNGMHCHGCEMLIKLTLSEIEGVKEVSANHITSIVEVEYDSSKVSLEQIFKAITEAGYEPIREETR